MCNEKTRLLLLLHNRIYTFLSNSGIFSFPLNDTIAARTRPRFSSSFYAVYYLYEVFEKWKHNNEFKSIRYEFIDSR